VKNEKMIVTTADRLYFDMMESFLFV